MRGNDDGRDEQLPCGDAAPSIVSTTPANGATGVATNANVVITFSENVNVTGSQFGISCTISGTHGGYRSAAAR